ncbi:MAG: hypothetical protein IJ030_04845 [Oscillospiraceae bacterium]|nr:hypothetical protein [Oscillospiraceae bacterium]
MAFWEKVKETWRRFKESEFVQKTGPVLKKIGYVLGLTAKWAYKLRGVLLAIPVAVIAVTLAVRNGQRLPTEVGINMLANGEYQWLVSRDLATMVPLAVTGVCLALVLCSKKVLYPWLISLFSLALPLVIWLTNIFPA